MSVKIIIVNGMQRLSMYENNFAFDSGWQLFGRMIGTFVFVIAGYLIPVEPWASAALFFGVGLGLFLIIVPVLNWYQDAMVRRLKKRREAMATTKESLVIDRKIYLERERQSTISRISSLESPQLQYAIRQAEALDIIEIEGGRVSWRINGMRIPVHFAVTWWEAYQQRGGDQLPADSDFSPPDRDIKREWNKTIITALAKLGVARPAESRYPGRWLVRGEEQRTKALERIGFWMALGIAERDE